MTTTKTHRTGFCNPSNPPDSHGRCPGTYRRGLAYDVEPCGCECHTDSSPAPAASPAAVEPPPPASAGEVIPPGIYSADELTNDQYHGEPDYLSSSALKRLLPEFYKEGGSQEALDFGTLFHTVKLEPERVADEYVVLDAHAIAGLNPKTGKPYDAPHMTAKFKAAAAEAAEHGRKVVSQEDWDRAHAMAAAVDAHDEAGPLMRQEGARSEVSLFVVDADGVRHKCRFDLMGGTVVGVDLKSTNAKPGAESLARAVVDYGYDLSAAHYLAVAELAGVAVEKFALIFVGKTEPYRVTVAFLDEFFLARGRHLRDRAIRRATDPEAEPYEGSTGRLTLTPPPWARIAPATTNAGIPADFTWSLDDYA